MYLLTAVGFGSTFVVFTFLASLLTDITMCPGRPSTLRCCCSAGQR
jgi:predicted MFS family arabinose efflux permease